MRRSPRRCSSWLAFVSQCSLHLEPTNFAFKVTDALILPLCARFRSATFPKEVQQLAFDFMVRDRAFLQIGRVGSTTVLIHQFIKQGGVHRCWT